VALKIRHVRSRSSQASGGPEGGDGR
jgi:hypothetical protein